jgi:integration host factor beta subunit
MTKKELIKKAHDQYHAYLQKDIALAVQVIFDSMADALRRGEKIEIRGFGSFTVRERKPRIARNPKSGESVSLQQRKIPFFKTGRELRLEVGKKR